LELCSAPLGKSEKLKKYVKSEKSTIKKSLLNNKMLLSFDTEEEDL
jgi:hypothetical protein